MEKIKPESQLLPKERGWRNLRKQTQSAMKKVDRMFALSDELSEQLEFIVSDTGVRKKLRIAMDKLVEVDEALGQLEEDIMEEIEAEDDDY